jgi:hypothetical protein
MLDCAGARGKHGATDARLGLELRTVGHDRGATSRDGFDLVNRTQSDLGRRAMIRTGVASLRVRRAAVSLFWLIPSLSFAQATGGLMKLGFQLDW